MNQKYNTENYWDDVASSIGQRSEGTLIAGDDEPYYRYKRKLFLDLFGSVDFKGKSVLELGSGPGGNLDFVHSRGARSVTGADVSSRMIELATALVGSKGVKLVKIDGRTLPFANNEFDVVFTCTVLMHNTDEEQLKCIVSELARVSAKEVMFFERIENEIKGHESNLGRPVKYYEALMNKSGFSLVATKGLPLQASYYVCGAIRKLFNPKSRKEGEPLTKFALFLEHLTMPITRVLDMIIPSNRDVMLLHFKKNN